MYQAWSRCWEYKTDIDGPYLHGVFSLAGKSDMKKLIRKLII